ncbi:MAG: helix-turn-helix transcriptional regulator [Syntrophobacteraceae bacterium]
MEAGQLHEIDALATAFLRSKIPDPERTAGRREKLERLASKLEISSKHLEFVLKGQRNLGTKLAEKLANLYGMTHLQMLQAGYRLVHGEGASERLVSAVMPNLTVAFPLSLKRYHDPHPLSKENYIPIRLLDGAAAARQSSEADESQTVSWILIYNSKDWMPNPPENYTCVRVHGESMYPILSDGDIVAIDHTVKDPHHLDGRMSVFRIDGGVTIKWLKYFREKALVVGVPENKETLTTSSASSTRRSTPGSLARWPGGGRNGERMVDHRSSRSMSPCLPMYLRSWSVLSPATLLGLPHIQQEHGTMCTL